mmetsp:Transcript_20802/g.30811  ORF Transcript_20802/g.30811 Transcript_20802/m.30811 type:complete len:293 (-) Transcript_20802:65-943(-)
MRSNIILKQIAIASLISNSWAFKHPVNFPRKFENARFFKMSNKFENLYVNVTPINTPTHVTYKISADLVDQNGTRRTWTVVRSENQFFMLHKSLSDNFIRSSIPKLPNFPDSMLIEDFIYNLINNRYVMTNPEFFDFIGVPSDVVEEPVLVGEVIDGKSWDGKRMKSATPSNEKELNLNSARIAGAFIGGAIGGPVGAMIGAVTVPSLSKRDGTIGDIAKNATKTTEEILGRAKEVDDEFQIKERVKKRVKDAYGKAKEVNEEYGIARKAGFFVGKVGNAIKNAAQKNRRKA